MNFTFDPESHRYTVDGIVFPSVTSVLESVGIIDYSGIPSETRSMALQRGSNVHLATQFDDEGDLQEESVPGLMGYVRAWRAARKHLGVDKFDPQWIERRGFHKQFRYAGTMDRADGDFILDLKTNQAPWWVRIQLAAYQELYREELPNVTRRIAVELHPNESFTIFEFLQKDFRDDFQTFMAALRIHNEKEMQRRVPKS